MKKITITDATLRECARRGDIALSFKEKLEIAKQELEKGIVTPFLKENNIPSATWNLDFTAKELTITWTTLGETSDCACQNGQCVNEA